MVNKLEKKIQDTLLVIDTKTRAILNTDDSEYERIKKIKNQQKKEKQEFEEMKSDIRDLKNSINTIMEFIKTRS